ncbi:kinase-like domain-containing protein [Fusarium flagelliforme]|uniref:kinase-like domain-containing protein n=1 Tax=Fusarium flagelliforme TaxID=2675880 RepID=UPI001E8DB3E5|nr:kinase-like domain-containing protein [Fusarium flagelliforme]KAH7183697.1 kinase-like domain-containing protein [Fusarium flagelliforme]
MSSIDPRPSTPPHHPNYGIQMSTDNIRKLVHMALPEVKLADIESLPSFKSYNNRIYFLKCSRHTADASDLESEEFVLKINGRDFKGDKIENEVSCLRLLEKICPGIPVPRMIAWSQDGSKMAVARSDGSGMEEQHFEGNTGGWILMTRVPGEPIDLTEHKKERLADLAVQLADHVTDWRNNIPRHMNGGSLRFQEDEYKNSRPDITLTDSREPGANLVIRGILGEGICCLDPIATVGDYYKVLMEHKLRTLETNETFEPNRGLVAPVRRFMHEILPAMSSLNTGADTFVFTHYDLSPRNVLISGSPPQITGIVDFEFAGFFPALDEFLNDYIENSNDWPKDVYEVYLKRLEENGVPTPMQSVEKDHWKQVYLLQQLVQNIAPWYLPGKYQGEGLEQELNKSKVLVEELLERLNRRR